MNTWSVVHDFNELKPFPTPWSFQPKTEDSQETDLQAVANDRVEWGRIRERVFHFPIRVTCNTGGDVLELIKRSHLASTILPFPSVTPEAMPWLMCHPLHPNCN
jgi:hypothetical protein